MTGEYEPLLADIDAMVRINPGNHTLWEQAAAAIRKLTAEQAAAQAAPAPTAAPTDAMQQLIDWKDRCVEEALEAAKQAGPWEYDPSLTIHQAWNVINEKNAIIKAAPAPSAAPRRTARSMSEHQRWKAQEPQK